jgi:hypothetical protein
MTPDEYTRAPEGVVVYDRPRRDQDIYEKDNKDDTDDDTSLMLMDTTGSTQSRSHHSRDNSDVLFHTIHTNTIPTQHNSDVSMLSLYSYVDGFADHEDSFGNVITTMSLPSNDLNRTDSHYNNRNPPPHQQPQQRHRIVLYYNNHKTTQHNSTSNTDDTTTPRTSLLDVRNRLDQNLQFIKDVQTYLGPFITANPSQFVLQYCDVSDRGTFALSMHIYSHTLYLYPI